MYFYLTGTDYRSAPQAFRELFYSRLPDIAAFWSRRGGVLLSTCNRIEVYAAAGTPDEASRNLEYFSCGFPAFSRYAYTKYGEKEVLRHALRLACGLESQIKGELQISEQLRNWIWRGDLPFLLSELWERALHIAEEIRKDSGLNDDKNNIASVLYSDINKRVSSSLGREIIVVGTGKIAGLLSAHRPLDTRLNFLAHKNYDKAESLAKISGGGSFLLKELPRLLVKPAILISATASPHYVLKVKDIIAAKRPLYIYDLASPRDVEPQIADLSGVHLYTIDDLQGAIGQLNEGNRQRTRLAAALVEEYIEQAKELSYARYN